MDAAPSCSKLDMDRMVAWSASISSAVHPAVEISGWDDMTGGSVDCAGVPPPPLLRGGAVTIPCGGLGGGVARDL